MGTIEDAVKAIILERFGNIAEFARTYNLNEQTLHSLFSKGSFAKSRMENVAPITHALELDPYWLLHGMLVASSTRFKGFVEVPLYSTLYADSVIQSGAGSPNGERYLNGERHPNDERYPDDERYPIPQELYDRYPGAFLLRMADSSMNRVLPCGCYALVEPCNSIERSGQPHAVVVGKTRATVKRAWTLGNGIELAPDSTDRTWHEAVYDFADESADKVTVLGRVVWYCIPLNWRFN